MGIAIFVSVLLFLVGAIFLQALRQIPAQPPTKAVVTKWGERTGKIKNEGWRFFWLFPYYYGFVPVDITRKNQDLVPEDVRTSNDMAELEISVSITWQPDAGINPDTGISFLLEYLNSGGEPGVKNILDDVVAEAIRELAANPVEEPFTWEDAVKMKEKFVARAAANVMGKDVAEISDDELKEIIRDLRRGNGKVKIEKLGILLSRLNITQIKPKGDLARAAEREATERREQKAEMVELKHISERIQEFVAIGFSREQSLELIQTERGKVKKDIKEIKGNLSQETREMVERIGAGIVQQILNGRQQNV